MWLTFAPIHALADAEYRTNVSHTQAHAAASQALQTAWNNNNTPYPNTQPQQTYQAFCLAQLALDATGQWAPGFIANVAAQFDDDYLALINTNYDGNPFVTCGINVQCN